MIKPTLLVLAAGMGSRYGGLKQLDVVGPNGEAIIDYSVYDAVKSGFDKVVFIIRKDIEADFRHHIGSRFEKFVDVEYAFQEIDKLPEGFVPPVERKKPWGTGHAVLCAEEYLDTPFAIINGDDFYGREGLGTLASYLSTLKVTDTSYAMVGYTLKNTLSEKGSVSRGVCEISDEGYLKKVVETLAIEKRGDRAFTKLPDGGEFEYTGEETVSLNLFGFTPAIFPDLKSEFKTFLEENLNKPKSEFYIPIVVDTLVDSNRASVKVLPSKGDWFGITYQADKPRVVEAIGKLVKEGLYSEFSKH